MQAGWQDVEGDNESSTTEGETTGHEEEGEASLNWYKIIMQKKYLIIQKKNIIIFFLNFL
jgi:hypothetical protein